MKKTILLILCSLLPILGANAARRQGETILRSVAIESNGTPAGFATAFLTDAAGNMVCGTSADADGRFELKAAPGTYDLTVALVGFKDAKQTVKLEGTLVELPPIRLEEDKEILGEAVVQAVMPKTKITGEGLATSVHGSVLENAGTAKDVLSKVPGLMKGRDGLEVIGKGAPQIYINGRKMTDATELDRLLSHEIQSVEVISNPGAQYDATVRAVVRIRTIKRQGEGFGFNANLVDQQSLQRKDINDPSGAINVNYRTGGVDIFGGINANKMSNFQLSDAIQETVFSGGTYKQEGIINADIFYKNAGLNGGANWQIDNNHFAGFKVDWTRGLSYGKDVLLDSDLFLDGALQDHLKTVTEGAYGNRIPYSLGANAYYNGTVGKIGIDLNLDYFRMTDSAEEHSREDSTIEDATVDTESASDNKLYATKLVISYPVWQGQLQVGTEETFSRRSDDYRLTGATIPSSSSRMKEDNLAAFIQYGFYLPKVGQISAGLRYEHVNYAFDDLLGEGSFTRKYDNLFPSLSYANAFGPVQVMFSYSNRTSRPSFSLLSDAIMYDNRYTLQSGNATLQPQTIQDISLTSLWKFLTLVVNYNRTDHPIITWADLFNEEGVILLKPHNLENPQRGLSTILTATPTIGVWSPRLTLGMQQGWLNVGNLSFNDKPIWIASLDNTFRFDKGWQVELGGEYHSPGYYANTMITNHFFYATAAVQKSLLRDGSLVIRLQGDDLARLGFNNLYTDLGYYKLTQTLHTDTQRLTLSIRYRFNTAESKYKGTGAGKDAKSRMQ